MNRTRSLIILSLICTFVVVVVGVIIYRLQALALRNEIARTFEVSAQEIASQLALPVKVNNVHEIARVISQSYLRQQSKFIILYDTEERPILSFPESSFSVASCKFERKTYPIIFGRENVGMLSYCFDLESMAHLVIPFYLFILSLLIMLLLTGVLWVWHRKSTILFDKFIQGLDSIDIQNGNLSPIIKSSIFIKTPLEHIAEKIEVLMRRLSDAVKERQELESQHALVQLSQQVSHDIQSPLAALKIFLHQITGLDNEQRQMIQGAVTRIQNIVTDLDRRPRGKINNILASANQNTEMFMILPTIESVVQEKQIFVQGIQITFEGDTESSFAFAHGNQSDFQRTISNLLQNSIDAVDKVGGKIHLKIQSAQESISVSIEDNGIGIPPDVIDRVWERGFSFGKSGGSGLGLYQAKKVIEGMNGSLQITSSPKNGTVVVAKISRAIAPSWFASHFRLSTLKRVVILDDDPSIAAIWKGRLGGKFAVLSFERVADWEAWVKTQTSLSANTFIIDHQLGTKEQSGLNLILNYNIHSSSILVTSQFDRRELQETCKQENILMLPKFLMDRVSIELVEL